MASYRIDLRERDIDVFGHVHYAEYLAFGAQARALWLRDQGIDRPGDNVVARVEIDYAASAHLADLAVLVELSVLTVGRSSMRLAEHMTTPDGREIARAQVVLVRFDPVARRSVPWSDGERSLLASRSRDSGPGMVLNDKV